MSASAPKPADLTRILGGIYLGSLQPIQDHTPLRAQYNVTHILSIIRFQIIPEYLVRKGYSVKNIPIDDDMKTDILKYINESNKFIDHCLYPNEVEYSPDKVSFKGKPQKNAIYIHCHAGVSRSSTFVIAYLMYRFNLSLKNALYAVQRKRPSIQPNENFMKQLEIFERIGSSNTDIINNKYYKQWKLENSIDNYEDDRENLINDDNFFKSEEDINNYISKLSITEKKKIEVARCKKCRQRLSLSSSFIQHTPPSKESSEAHFLKKNNGGRRGVQESQDVCSHYFVEPLNWMKGELQGKQELEGKFSCPNCSSKVGGYNWKGSRCSCGKWVVPAIHILSNKVDLFPLQTIELPNVVKFEEKKA
ncbi:hypothetical protein TBLA_0A00710 [Henningerozyma blattae CBS 6284]|uniref:protein-tyrosine-phosphatase n=1 Tax=Henningerozyma blattae (strain ATCC 34711 / CBS 6284 / DSM 70876 / NBRC 10599 / NRRL Y-10934 / UCD 77-7) TaxID=1071380 RepID=I2GUS0_HENB6|nr:hypothetical protein TBLA_0A00710 [Tetrapisispora blattae CBS 6284]CCH57872.1 hypothetical protein TBLA_0A00710 [Tetrapisispora blattae CBS 6284]